MSSDNLMASTKNDVRHIPICECATLDDDDDSEGPGSLSSTARGNGTAYPLEAADVRPSVMLMVLKSRATLVSSVLVKGCLIMRRSLKLVGMFKMGTCTEANSHFQHCTAVPDSPPYLDPNIVLRLPIPVPPIVIVVQCQALRHSQRQSDSIP